MTEEQNPPCNALPGWAFKPFITPGGRVAFGVMTEMSKTKTNAATVAAPPNYGKTIAANIARAIREADPEELRERIARMEAEKKASRLADAAIAARIEAEAGEPGAPFAALLDKSAEAQRKAVAVRPQNAYFLPEAIRGRIKGVLAEVACLFQSKNDLGPECEEYAEAVALMEWIPGPVYYRHRFGAVAGLAAKCDRLARKVDELKARLALEVGTKCAECEAACGECPPACLAKCDAPPAVRAKK